MGRLKGKSTCPACLVVMEGYTQVGGTESSSPQPGSTTVCGYCLAPLVFDDKMLLRRLDLDSLPEDEAAFMRAVIEELARAKRIVARGGQGVN